MDRRKRSVAALRELADLIEGREQVRFPAAVADDVAVRINARLSEKPGPEDHDRLLAIILPDY